MEGACRECPGCHKHFLAKCSLGFSPLLHPALELQEVALALPKVELYFELCKMLFFSPSTHLIKMALGSCVNNIVSLKPPPHAWLFPAFSNKQRPLTLTLKTSPSSLKRGTFFWAKSTCFQQLVQKHSGINYPASFFCALVTSYLASQSVRKIRKDWGWVTSLANGETNSLIC